MATYHEPMYLSDVLLTEVARGWTTQTIKVKTDTALAIGTVLYYVDGQDYLTAEPSDYTRVAGILAEKVESSDDVKTSLAIVRGAVVATENLIFPNDVSDDEKKQALSTLNTMGIMTQGEILPIATIPLPEIDRSNVVTGEGSGAIGD
ncbi:Uncharacterised protein [Moraxella caprae]|uniref:Uncharacterized protein n=1 Tax=Moraxella caprae TaxID=90240 RepID=A0A378R059_9GAMM|nr:head decoration protein [Moraxella caprae]STZ08594.1 Uncharacterised protein [Moraxella caprae]